MLTCISVFLMRLWPHPCTIRLMGQPKRQAYCCLDTHHQGEHVREKHDKANNLHGCSNEEHGPVSSQVLFMHGACGVMVCSQGYRI